VFITDGSSTETWGDSGHDADDYDVTMTENGSGGHYVGSFDADGNIAEGTYRVAFYLQAGANPADTDELIGQTIFSWDGDERVTEYEIWSVLKDIEGTGFVKDTDSLVNLAHTGADGDTLETLSDQLDDIATDVETVIALESKTLNVYPTGVKTTITGGSVLGVPDDEKEIR